MASWMIHLRIAALLLRALPSLEETAFVVGNIAPDSGVPSSDWSCYTPSKAVSHYKVRQGDDSFFDVAQYARDYLRPEQRASYDARQLSFYLGYYAHLLTDAAWTREICGEAFARFPQDYAKDQYALINRCKRDWYDLDFLYLQQHPDFHAFAVYENAVGFRNTFISAFNADAFELRRQYICRFYRGPHGDLQHEYPYLTRERADRFVEETAQSIANQIKSMRYL